MTSCPKQRGQTDGLVRWGERSFTGIQACLPSCLGEVRAEMQDHEEAVYDCAGCDENRLRIYQAGQRLAIQMTV